MCDNVSLLASLEPAWFLDTKFTVLYSSTIASSLGSALRAGCRPKLEGSEVFTGIGESFRYSKV